MTRLGKLLVALLLLGGLALATMVTLNRRWHPLSAAVERLATGGDLIVPVQGVAAATLVDDWNDPRGGGARQHHALDIPAPAGTPVLAVANGRIEKLFTSVLGGLTIYQRSADGGTVYYYAHLDRYAPTLAEGQAVRQGEPIAAVGSTGDASEAAPHLHFEIHRMAPGDRWWQGEGVDPYPLFRTGG